MNRNLAIAMIAVLLALAGVTALLLPGGNNAPNTAREPDHETMSASGQSESNNSRVQTTDAGQATATTEVKIEDYAYVPATIKVKAGDTVTWTNKDTVRHDVQSDVNSADAPSSSLLDKDESYSFKFTKAGTYTYHCSPHPYMKGTVIVE